jgi:hypothetical protein
MCRHMLECIFSVFHMTALFSSFAVVSLGQVRVIYLGFLNHRDSMMDLKTTVWVNWVKLDLSPGFASDLLCN